MGEVWRGEVRDVRGRPQAVAVKVITSETSRDAWFQNAFANEVRAVAGLDHPHIVRVFDYGRISENIERESDGALLAGSPYLVMEWVSGGTLKELPTSPGFPALRRLLCQLLDALAHAHARGVVHRDLKPINVLVGGHGDFRPGIKLADFGLARPKDFQERPEAAGGTPSFMAPEQVAGSWRDQGPWTDLYALGCLAWRMATGAPPFHGSDRQEVRLAHLHDPLPDLVPAFDVPPGFEEWLSRLLAKRPLERFQLAADAYGSLMDLVEPTSSSARIAPVGLCSASEAAEMTFHSLPTQRQFATEEVHLITDDGTRPMEQARGRRGLSLACAPGVALDAWRKPFQLPETWRGGTSPSPPIRLPGTGLGLYGLRVARVVGREPERDTVWGALRQVCRDGQMRVVVLRGQAGVGKSRLAAWLCERAQEVGAALSLTATHTAAPGPSDGLVAMVSRHLRTSVLSPRLIESRVAELYADHPDLKPADRAALVAILAGGEDEVARDNDPDGTGAPLRLRVLAGFLRRLARHRPLVLWLDDAHWSPRSIELVTDMLNSQGAGGPMAPILVVLTVETGAGANRDAEMRLGELLGRPEALEISVGPMTGGDLDALVRGHYGLDPALAREVGARSHGVPLYAVQLVGDWVQADLLAGAPQGFRARPEVALALPDNLDELWLLRIDRVLAHWPSAAGEALEAAALLGQVVTWAEWTSICSDLKFTGARELVEALLYRDLVVAPEGGPEQGWTFVHGQLRVVLERRAIDLDRAARHHRLCASALLRSEGSAVVARRSEERRALHLVHGDRPKAALAPLLGAIARRISEGDVEVAVELSARWQAAARKSGLKESDTLWAKAWLNEARLLRLQGHLKQAKACLERVEQAGRAWGWEAELVGALRDLGRMARERGEPRQAALLLEEGRARAAAADLASAQGDCLIELGWLHLGLGDTGSSRQAFLASAEVYTRLGDQQRLALVWSGLADLAHQEGDAPLARVLLERASRTFEALGTRWGVANCLNKLGDVARFQGDLDEAELRYREARAAYRALGSASRWFAQLNLCVVLLFRGRWSQAESDLGSCLVVFEKQGRASMQAACQVCLAAASAGRGDFPSVHQHLSMAERLLEETAFVDADIAEIATLTAELAARAGRRMEALRATTLAAAQWRALGRSGRAVAIEADVHGRMGVH